MKAYIVDYAALIDGTAVVEAESKDEAESMVRESLEPSLSKIMNDDLVHREKFFFDSRPLKVQKDK